MRYKIFLTPTAKSDMVNLKLSLDQRFVDTAIIKKNCRKFTKKYVRYQFFLNDILL